MANYKNKTFVGFGLGAVQAGLFLNEAMQSGNFERFVVIEVNKDLIERVRKNNSTVMLNTATNDGVVTTELSGIEIYDPLLTEDMPKIAEAVHAADEIATAIPSVDFYESSDENSVASILAKNINPDKQQILYASENNNYAAEILTNAVEKRVKDKSHLKNFQILNTVIGKMGGLISEPDVIENLRLLPIVPGHLYAFLVEQFNHIIVSKVLLADYRLGIEVFEEKDDLLPFEEAKLFGHNTVHSLLGYLAYFKGYTFMSQIRDDKELYEIGREAFDNECGATLIKKYAELDDKLFTPKGFNYYGEDLLLRMTNPYLNDKVSRICRDPRRKLGYNDRFFGAMTEAIKQGVKPLRQAQGALSALLYAICEKENIGIDLPNFISDLNRNDIRRLISELWTNEKTNGYQDSCLDLIDEVYRPLLERIN